MHYQKTIDHLSQKELKRREFLGFVTSASQTAYDVTVRGLNAVASRHLSYGYAVSTSAGFTSVSHTHR
ncbi:MAG: hypothetical protein K0S68_664 [Candidatus Saccharibacteria bacterium]|jgi:hypothetical protein|nr:hypothetical protein [Candidatus Saccharibacteria bacterium]